MKTKKTVYGDLLTCPECRKEIGVQVLTKTEWIAGLGAVNVYDQKHDFRKASHISFGDGLICKTCARKHFPDGVAYKVTVDYHGRRITPYVGIRRTGLFSTRKEAYYAARDMNNRCRSNNAYYEEVKL